MPISKRTNKVYKDFLALIEQHYATEHELAFYSNQLGISNRQLNKLAEAVGECTPKSLIDKKLIREAKKLLNKTQLPISKVADRLGFKSQVTFCRLFKRVVGCTASEYRHDPL